MTIINNDHTGEPVVAFLDSSRHVTRETKCAKMFDSEEQAFEEMQNASWYEDYVVAVNRDFFLSLNNG